MTGAARRSAAAAGTQVENFSPLTILAKEFDRPITSADLELTSGLDRFELARCFRRQVGTSPHRYLVGRRLEAVWARTARDENMAEAAIVSGFADQSHMPRHFEARYGMTPGCFARLPRRHRSPTAGPTNDAVCPMKPAALQSMPRRIPDKTRWRPACRPERRL